MKKISLAVFVFSLSLLQPVSSEGKTKSTDRVNERARSLIHRMQTQPQKPPTAATPLLNFSSSPGEPKQGQNLTWFVQFDSPFSNRGLSIDAKLNGTILSNIQSPSKGVFVVPLGRQIQAGPQNLEVTLFAENTANNTDVRAAIAALDTDINRLTNQINAQRDPVKRAVLQSQRAEKLALKNELVTQLKAYRYKLGVQTKSYTVATDQESPTLPHVSGLFPSSGSAAGAEIAVNGENFTAPVEMYLGGVLVTNATIVNPSTITALTPNYGTSVGLKDLELRFTTAEGPVTVSLPSAFFAFAPPQEGVARKPVAVASGSQQIRLGQTAQLDGSLSYDDDPAGLGYEWKIASVPAGSNYSVGQVVSTDVAPALTPTAYGTYVIELRATEISAPHLVSDPSIAVIQVDGTPQPTANPIIVTAGASAFTQVFGNSPRPGMEFFYSISTQPSLGTATVSATGRVTYTSTGSTPAIDSLIIKVADQSGLYGLVTIPVTILAPSTNQPPYFTDNHLYFTMQNQGLPVNTWLEPNDQVLDDDGEITECIYTVDGIEHRANFPVDGCFVPYDFFTTGDHVVKLTIVDNEGATASVTQTVNIVNEPFQSGRFTLDPTYGAAPLTVNGVGLETQSPNGIPIPAPQWRFTDGAPRIPGFTMSRTYENDSVDEEFGEGIRYRTYAELTNYSSLWRLWESNVKVGGSPLAGGSRPIAVYNTPATAQATVGVPFVVDGSESFDVTLGGSIASYYWEFGDGLCEEDCNPTTPTASHTFSNADNFFTFLTVTGPNGAEFTNYREVHAAIQGNSPRSVLRVDTTEGTAPLTVHFDASGSFDTDGTITQYTLDDGNGDFDPQPVGPTAEVTYSQPGLYQIQYSVEDNDGNHSTAYSNILVLDPESKVASKKVKKLRGRKDAEEDQDRERKRKLLTGACGKGNGRACYDLSKMHLEDGDTIMAQKLKEKACEKGYAPACSAKK